MRYAINTPSRLRRDTSKAIGPRANLRITKSICNGPRLGVTPVVRNSFTLPAGRKRRENCVRKPPTMNPPDKTKA